MEVPRGACSRHTRLQRGVRRLPHSQLGQACGRRLQACFWQGRGTRLLRQDGSVLRRRSIDAFGSLDNVYELVDRISNASHSAGEVTSYLKVEGITENQNLHRMLVLVLERRGEISKSTLFGGKAISFRAISIQFLRCVHFKY